MAFILPLLSSKMPLFTWLSTVKFAPVLNHIILLMLPVASLTIDISPFTAEMAL